MCKNLTTTGCVTSSGQWSRRGRRHLISQGTSPYRIGGSSRSMPIIALTELSRLYPDQEGGADRSARKKSGLYSMHSPGTGSERSTCPGESMMKVEPISITTEYRAYSG